MIILKSNVYKINLKSASKLFPWPYKIQVLLFKHTLA